LVAACFIVFNVLAPRFLHEAAVLRNRELPILFAAAGGLGATWLTHRLGLSPAIGAFIGGMLLAESPFANQVRADLASLRTLLVTLFFGSVGMLADIPWIVEHIVPVLVATAAVLIGKSLIAWLSLRLAGLSHVSSLAAAICLAQVGEFSFVIISAARGDLLGEHVFLLAVSTMMLSLFLTPYLVSGAPAAAKKSLAVLRRFGILGGEARPAPDPRTDFMGHVILIGYGPAGERVGQILAAQKAPAWVLDLNPQLVKKARETGLNAQIGDATHPEVLEHLHPASARAIIVTLPDPAAVRTIISLARAHAPEAVIVARCRYHIHRSDLEGAGASVVVDEEDEVGGLLGTKLVEVAGLARKEVESNAAAAETV
jgi:CPA2 family monovalent cation:H+ antiporter-2